MDASTPIEFAIEFETEDQATADLIRETFKDDEVMSASSFDGGIVIIIVSTATALLGAAYRFYAKHKDTVKGGKVVIDKKKVSLEGFSAYEINEMVEKGTLQKIQEKLS